MKSQESDQEISPATGGTSGIAFSAEPGGEAIVPKYGVAYAMAGGRASAGASGVALSKGGEAITAEGGVSVGHNAGKASCGAHGVAYSASPRPQVGSVMGGIDSILMITWIDGEKTFAKSARVGDTVDGGTIIQPGVWYTLDKQGGYKWIVMKG